MEKASGSPPLPLVHQIDRKSLNNSELIQMIISGDEEALGELQKRENPFPVPVEGKEDNSPFHIAAQCGKISLYQHFEAKKREEIFATQNHEGETPLLLAVLHNHLPMVSYLLSHGSSIDEKNLGGNTSLLHAASAGHLEMVKWLLSNGSSIEEEDSTNMTSLLYASFEGHLEIVKWLLSHGSDIREENHFQMDSVLCAAFGGHLETIQWLLSNGGSIGKTDQRGATSLHFAAQRGHFDVVKWLLAHGCNMDSEVGYKSTSLILAAKENHFEIVEFLLHAGAQADGLLRRLDDDPSFELLEILVNYGNVCIEDLQSHCNEEHFSSFMAEMNRKKTNKRAVH